MSRAGREPDRRGHAIYRGSGQPAERFRPVCTGFGRAALELCLDSVDGQGNQPIPPVAAEHDAEDSGQKALNYKTEPMWQRLGYAPTGDEEFTRTIDFTNALSNSQVGGDPETPVFTANAGDKVRFRLLQPDGHARNSVFVLHGHTWQREPYVNNSTMIGDNPLSEWKSSQEGHGPSNHFEIIPVNGAGGKFGVRGDYLYRDMSPIYFENGVWGIFRVE